MRKHLLLVSLPIVALYAQEESVIDTSNSIKKSAIETAKKMQGAAKGIESLNDLIVANYEEFCELASLVADLKEQHQTLIKQNALIEANNFEELASISNKIRELENQINHQVASNKNKINFIQQAISRTQESIATTQDIFEKNSDQIAELDQKSLAANDQITALQMKINHLISDLDQIKQSQEENGVLPKIVSFRSVERPGGFGGVQFLYWTVYENQTFFAVTGQEAGSSSFTGAQDSGSIGNVKSMSYDWKPGYRLNLGYCFRPDFWEIEGVYTYFYDKGNSSIDACSSSSNPTKALVGTFDQGTQSPIFTAKSFIRLNYNQGDLLLGRKFMLTDHLLLRFLFGATGSWITQNWRYAYEGASTVKGKQDWKFYGGGMRIGLDADWYIGKGWGFLTKANLGILAGTFREFVYNETNNAGNSVPTPPNVVQDINLKDHRFAYHTQIAFLPSWGKMYSKWGFSVFAGYELNLWFNLHQIYCDTLQSNLSFDTRKPITENGLVGFQGLTTGLQFQF